jgi:hypothetical protein
MLKYTQLLTADFTENNIGPRISQMPALIRDGPFNFQGGYGFIYKKIFWFLMMLKKYSDFGGGKKNNLIQSFVI